MIYLLMELELAGLDESWLLGQRKRSDCSGANSAVLKADSDVYLDRGRIERSDDVRLRFGLARTPRQQVLLNLRQQARQQAERRQE
jgi:hypothetical protein